MSNQEIIREFNKQGIRAQEFQGHVIQVVDAFDDNCRRHDVEIWRNGRWETVVIASLDWSAELAKNLAKTTDGRAA